MTGRQSWVAIGLAIALASLGGCDTRDVAPENQNPYALNAFIEAPRLDGAPTTTPQGTLLLWWRSLQYRETDTARRLMTRAARRRIPSEILAYAAAGSFGQRVQRTRLVVGSVTSRSGVATAQLQLRTRVPIITPDTVQMVDRDVSAELVHIDGHWLIARADFLEDDLEAVLIPR